MTDQIEQGQGRATITADDKIAALSEEFNTYKAVSEERERCKEKIDEEREKLTNERENRAKERTAWVGALIACLATIVYLIITILK